MLFKKISIIFCLIPIVFGLNRKQLVDYAVKQYTKLSHQVKNGIQYPVEGDPKSEHWKIVSGQMDFDFRVGHYSGVLWNLYEYTMNDEWKQLAITATDGLFKDENVTTTHDIGFQFICSYGEGYKYTKNSTYPPVLINAANHLATRYNPKIGCTRSWNSHNDGQFLVIADNMMNLELLFEAWKLSGNKTLYDMAVSHTNVTIKEHLRKDYSSFHVVSFNETTGVVIKKYTAQGYADWSTWSRAHGWLIYGFTAAYRYTKMDHILKAAEGVSNYFIDNAPSDGIPYWDFNVPHDANHTYIPRDSSAASVAASGLIELFGFTNNTKYLNAFNKIMDSLFSDGYRADGKPEYKLPALIVNGTGTYKNGDYDYAFIFGDYYFAKNFAHFK